MRRLRMERKLTLGKLSEIAGVPESKIDHYELGKNELPLDHMFKIACALDVEIEGYSPA